jgi:hypothetical protein
LLTLFNVNCDYVIDEIEFTENMLVVIDPSGNKSRAVSCVAVMGWYLCCGSICCFCKYRMASGGTFTELNLTFRGL